MFQLFPTKNDSLFPIHGATWPYMYTSTTNKRIYVCVCVNRHLFTVHGIEWHPELISDSVCFHSRLAVDHCGAFITICICAYGISIMSYGHICMQPQRELHVHANPHRSGAQQKEKGMHNPFALVQTHEFATSQSLYAI